ncbi:response regulator [Dechloromonas sp. A34]|uniref:response regulator n=1 Tax=Dechloromonas sp. A34 TaxID=447588 RepID=UPI00224935A4|nr:response regulator [Dechloromonas sp. A34]
MTPLPSKMKVLAVDDNRTNLHILQVFLKKLGHDVILAENGDEAVRRFQSDAPDLILLDIMMPIMDGFEAARRIKAMSRERWTPVIFLSALNRDENLVEGLDAGADDYLTKPINFVVLEAKLRSMQRSLAMQQASIDSLRRLQTISDNVADAIVTMDEQGLIASTNRSAERIFGWPSSKLLGQNIRTLIPDLAHNVGAGNTGLEREVEAQHRDGRRFAATISVTQIDLDNKRVSIGVIRDISERIQAEKELRDSAHQLQGYFEQTQNEQQLAMRLMEKQLHRSGLKDERLRYKVIPAENFSGDIVAAARSPKGASMPCSPMRPDTACQRQSASCRYWLSFTG